MKFVTPPSVESGKIKAPKTYFKKPQNAPFCTYVLMLLVCRTVFDVTFGGKAAFLEGAIASLLQRIIALARSREPLRILF